MLPTRHFKMPHQTYQAVLQRFFLPITPSDQKMLGWCPAGSVLLQGSSFALFTHPNDGVTMKITQDRYLNSSTSLTTYIFLLNLLN